ncbi:HAMP domain-containing histidine kinase [Ensifer adhaerens]|uniref:sensor histidine kinase n=1 Tax=Ensifer adhaerens TaxID=106592 RepID=UPI001CC0BDFB|nr:HAMP domain-containing sensor histidine kinase [Ensifer adhaerens]MBZ7926799.1 HAMP domain-containing histidine kinase [Ensifer adhaerens]UAX96885.1 HAMP domain-containing histidine kinase [Ensifer adhaerens]UAY03771.1 HAMP domain-containing histidine kinase [Ensifer adhaerens]UAY11755.1 HAMP domain-containing histidine kinase [Ensifer adhaerens]
MTKARPRSLQWVLVRRLILLQAATLFVFIGLLFVALFIAQPRLVVENEAALDILYRAVGRDADGTLMVRKTEELGDLRQSYPNLWFVIRDMAGQVLQEGDVPAPYLEKGGDLLQRVEGASLLFDDGGKLPDAILRNVDTDAGRVQIITSTVSSRRDDGPLDVQIGINIDVARDLDGKTAWTEVVPMIALLILCFLLPIILVMGVTTLVTAPAVVRRSLASLISTADQAGRIDIDNRAVQLETEKVPTEIAPLVQAFNKALARLGEGYDQRNRFLTDAAHELRTPIAILRTRAELLQEAPESARLRLDIERLSHLAQQLLDRQVLEHAGGALEVVDLVAMARTIAADFAPLAFEAGYELAFETAVPNVPVNARPRQIEQAVANLLRNAIEHGGGTGTITVLVNAERGLEIQDEGPGIPAEERERVFEPFYRLRPRSTGAGLGLNLAREIARLHGGRIDILAGPWRGARVRLQLPLLDGGRSAQQSVPASV